MEAIELRADLKEQLAKDAKQEKRSVSEIVNEAVEHYMRERQRAKLDVEIAAYERMHPELKQKYWGSGWRSTSSSWSITIATERRSINVFEPGMGISQF